MWRNHKFSPPNRQTQSLHHLSSSPLAEHTRSLFLSLCRRCDSQWPIRLATADDVTLDQWSHARRAAMRTSRPGSAPAGGGTDARASRSPRERRRWPCLALVSDGTALTSGGVGSIGRGGAGTAALASGSVGPDLFTDGGYRHWARRRAQYGFGIGLCFFIFFKKLINIGRHKNRLC